MGNGRLIKENAWGLGDYDRNLVLRKFLLYQLLKAFRIKDVDLEHVLNADRTAQLHDIDGRYHITLKGLARSRMILVSGHTCCGIVKDHNGARALVIYHVHQGIDTRMHEGRIAYNGNPVLNVILTPCLLHSVKGRD